MAQTGAPPGASAARVVRVLSMLGGGSRVEELTISPDATGRGHVTRTLGPITNVFLHLPDDFDVVAWARGVCTAAVLRVLR